MNQRLCTLAFQTSTTTGTGALTLNGAPPAGFVAYRNELQNGYRTTVHVDDKPGGSNWENLEVEMIRGASATADRLSVIRVLANNAGTTSKINWGSGVRNVTPLLRPEILAPRDEDGRLVLDNDKGARLNNADGSYWRFYTDTAGDLRFWQNVQGHFLTFKKVNVGAGQSVNEVYVRVNLVVDGAATIGGKQVGDAAFLGAAQGSGHVVTRGSDGRIKEADLPATTLGKVHTVTATDFNFANQRFYETNVNIPWTDPAKIKVVTAHLRCLITEGGWPVGTRIPLSGGTDAFVNTFWYPFAGTIYVGLVWGTGSIVLPRFAAGGDTFLPNFNASPPRWELNLVIEGQP